MGEIDKKALTAKLFSIRQIIKAEIFMDGLYHGYINS